MARVSSTVIVIQIRTEFNSKFKTLAHVGSQMCQTCHAEFESPGLTWLAPTSNMVLTNRNCSLITDKKLDPWSHFGNSNDAWPIVDLS